MNKFFILAIIVLIIGIGVIGYIFFIGDNYKVQELKFINVSISAYDLNERVTTNYKIFNNGFLLNEGETREFGSVIQSIPLNSKILIQNSNKEGQNYYITKKEFQTNNSINYLVNLKIEKPTEIIVKNKTEKNIIVLNLSTTKIYKQVGFCVDYSTKVVWVETNNSYEQIFDKKGIIKYFSKCWLTKNDANNLTIKIDYNTWGILDENDYIKIYIFDSQDGIYQKEENINGELFYDDLFGENKEIKININNI